MTVYEGLMYTANDINYPFETKEEIEESLETSLKPQLSLEEQTELATILNDLARNFSTKEKLIEIVQKIMDSDFDLSSKVPLLEDETDIFTLIQLELKACSQLLPTQISNIMVFLKFCARITLEEKEELINLLYVLLRQGAFEDQQKVELFKIFLENVQSSKELNFDNFVVAIPPNYSDELVLPILEAYINRFGIDPDLVTYGPEKRVFIASIVQKIDLRALRDFSLSNVVADYAEHITRGNLLLIEMLCQQAVSLAEIQAYPFFHPILAWSLDCFKQTLSIEETAKIIPSVTKVLIICLEKNLVKFQNKNQYLDNLKCIIEKIESYRLIDYMAKHEMTKTLEEYEKKDYLKYLLMSSHAHTQNFKINLLRLGIHWNLLIDEITASLGGLDPKLMQGFVIEEQKKEQEEQTIIHVQGNVSRPIVDNSLFGHIHNGFWLRGTKWEGNTFVNTLGYISKKLNDHNVPSYCRKHLKNANIIVQLLAAFNNQSYASSQQPEHAYFYAYELAKRAKKLFDEDQSIAIPAGWSDGFGSGHAVIYNIIQFEEKVYLMVFNTGDGINYHRQFHDSSTGRTQFFNSQVFLIQDSNILIALITELLIPALVKNIQQGANAIYEDILPNFVPQYMQPVDSEPLLMHLGVEIIDPQFSGICSWEVIETWLLTLFKFNKNVDLWHELLLKVKYHSFLDYLESLKNISLTAGQQRLITQAKQGMDDKCLWDRLTPEQQSNLNSLLTQVMFNGVVLIKDTHQIPSVSHAPANAAIIPLIDAIVTGNVIGRSETKIESESSMQKTLCQLEALIASPEACYKPESWDILQQHCQAFNSKSQFDYVIYYIEKWLFQIDYSNLEDKNKDLLYKLMHKMTELNYTYLQALHKNVFVHTKEKHFMVWSTLLLGTLIEKYFQNLLKSEEIKELQDSFLRVFKEIGTEIRCDQLLVLDQNDIALLQKIKKMLKGIPDDFDSRSSLYMCIGLIGEHLRTYAETAESVKKTYNSCRNKQNVSIRSLIELWQNSVVVGTGWSEELKSKIEAKNLEKIDQFFYIAVMFILNSEYCFRMSSQESPQNLVEYLKKFFPQEDSSHSDMLIVYKSFVSGDNVLSTIPSDHLIKKVASIETAVEDDEDANENVAIILLKDNFSSNFKEAYLIYQILCTKYRPGHIKQIDVINIHLFITFFKECQLKLLETHYQNFIFHSLYNSCFIYESKNDPAFALLVQTLLDGVSNCQKDNHLDLAMLFYIKTIYSLSLVDPQNSDFDLIIHRIDQMVEQCVAENSNSFLLHQLYCYQFLFAWSQYSDLEAKNGLNPETKLRLMGRILYSRLKMTQDIYMVSDTEQNYADDPLVQKFIQSAEIALESYLSCRTVFVDSPEFSNMLLTILHDSAILKQAQIIPIGMMRAPESTQVKFGDFLYFDFSRSTWVHQNNTYSQLIPYGIAKTNNYKAIFGNKILVAQTEGKTYNIQWMGNDYFIDAISGNILRHAKVQNCTHKMQLMSLEQLMSADTAITKITNSLPLILFEQDYTFWVNTDRTSDLVFALAHKGAITWLGNRSGSVKKVLKQKEGLELQYHDTLVLLAPQDLPIYLPWALNFESPLFIECIASKVIDKIQPISVRFLRYGLELTAIKTDFGYGWHLQDGRNWALVEQLENVWLPHFYNYLVFKESTVNSDGSQDVLFMVPYLKKFHADLYSESGQYLKSSCEHGHYVLKLDTHFSEIFSLNDNNFQRAQKKYMTEIANKKLNDTQKYITLKWSSKTNTIEIQSLASQHLWYLAYIYLSQHQPDCAIPILKELKQRVCFANLEEWLILKWIFCEIPAKFGLELNDRKFEEKATISNPNYIAVKLYALFILASHQTLNFSLLPQDPNNPAYVVAQDMLRLGDTLFLDAILGVFSDYIDLSKSEEFNKTVAKYLTPQELKITLFFIKAYHDQSIADIIAKLTNKKLLLRVEQLAERKAIENHIQSVKEYSRILEQYFKSCASFFASNLPTAMAVQAVDYKDYYYKAAVEDNKELKETYENRQKIQTRFQDNSGKKLRPIQKQFLAAFNKDNQLFSMPMGSGKTKAGLPCAAALTADGVHLATIVFLEELFELNSRDFKKTFQEALELQSYEFIFDRNAKYSSVRFQAIYDVINTVILSKGCIVTSRESLAALQLTFIELLEYWDPQQKNAEELGACVFHLNGILELFLERNVFFIDEMDAACDFKKRNLIYPIGEPAKPETALFELLLACYNVLITLPEISTDLRVGNALPKQKLDNFKTLVLPTIIQAFMKSSELLTIVCKQIRLTERELSLYLNNQCSIDQKSYLVNSLYKLLYHVLPIALSMDLNGKFGFSKTELDPVKRHWAIPFKNAEAPSEGSSYSKYLFTIWLTICAVRTEGIFQNLLQHILLNFKLKYMIAVIPIDELNAEFQKYFPEKDISNIQVYLDKIADFHGDFSKSEKFVEYCLQHFILPSIQQYDTQLISTPYDFCAQPLRIKGFTGTSSNNLFLSPLRLVDLNPSNIDLILAKLREELTKESITYMDRNNDKAIISQMLDKINKNPNLRFIIELGGWFRGQGCANLEIARNLLAGTGDDIDWVVFFNGNKLSAISKKDSNIIGFETSEPLELAAKLGADLSKRLVYIDQQHARGADLPQTLTTEAIVTVRETTLLDEFMQAGTRLRELLGKQKLSIMAPNEVKELCLDFQAFEELFRNNQKEERANMAPQAIVGQLRGHVRQLILKKILTISTLVGKKSLLQQGKELFILQNESDDSLDIERQEPVKELLNGYAQKLIFLYQSLMPEEALQTLPDLRATCETIINSKLAFCKPTLLAQSNTLLPKQEDDQECQLSTHMSIVQQFTANECQMTHANEIQQTGEQELQNQNENETEIKRKVANAKLIARVPNLAFIFNTWTIMDFQNIGAEPLEIHGMQFFRISEFSELSSCHLDPGVYIAENAAYTLGMQKPSLAKPIIHVLGICSPSDVKFIIISVIDNAFLYELITTLSEQLTADHYIWLTTLQAGNDLVKAPSVGHRQYRQMLVLWEQIQFCAGNVQYLIELANRKQLQWLTTGNVLEKLSVLTKLVNLYNPSSREYLNSLSLKINRLTTELSQPLLISHTIDRELKETRDRSELEVVDLQTNSELIEKLNKVQKAFTSLEKLPGNELISVSSVQANKLLGHAVAAEMGIFLKPLDKSLGSSSRTRAHQS